MKTIEAETKKRLGKEYELFCWAERLLHNGAKDLVGETGMPYNNAFTEVAGYNVGAARIYLNGVAILQGKFSGALKDRSNEKTEKHIKEMYY
ncbi:MAG: hypothetical protein ACE5FU_11790 [Nitrospinota bacterium]